MKQTAVEWFKDVIESFGNKHELQMYWDTFDELLEQAKAMEKEHIGRAYQEGLIDGMNHTPKDYYNKTYGGEDKS
jgi:hypothetical protein